MILSPAERRVFSKLSSPSKIQDFLDTLSINFELNGETYMSPRRTLMAGTAHCFEGALLAAAALAYHGHKPLLMDFQTIPRDEDHVVALFRQNGYWGAISKTNHSILRYRDPIYSTPRELALSFFNEYIMDDGTKSLRAYSAPFDLGRYAPADWMCAEEDLVDIVNDLDDSRHFPIVPKKNMRKLRKASSIERKILEHTEWKSGQSKGNRAG